MAIKEIVIYPNDILSTPTKKTDLKTAQNIAVDLFKTLNAEGGLGLSANQIGEDKSVCVVNVTEPFFLQNPKIVKKEKEIIYKEGCLSIPDKMITTKRYEKIWVKADNIEEEMYFGPQKEKKYDFKTNSYTANDLLILEAVCVQHEIDHLNGLTIYDREHKLEQYKRTERKIGRNEKVTITKDKETLTLKYKKAIPYLEKGWVINGQT
jgi:peptide deformylase|tara:strand:- start:214 stop:837 length:624 start_codon:yes stop_codon:yes gene_type:complete